MSASEERVEKLLAKLDAAWAAFKGSYAGVPDAQLVEPGVVDDWSVKDVLAHVTTWEAEALKHLPLIIQGGRPPKYATFGGIDAFNAQMIEQKRHLSLADVRKQLGDTHQQLIDFVRQAPAVQFSQETRPRRRLRLDTYSHYPEHTEAIRMWREQRAPRRGGEAWS